MKKKKGTHLLGPAPERGEWIAALVVDELTRKRLEIILGRAMSSAEWSLLIDRMEGACHVRSCLPGKGESVTRDELLGALEQLASMRPVQALEAIDGCHESVRAELMRQLYRHFGPEGIRDGEGFAARIPSLAARAADYLREQPGRRGVPPKTFRQAAAQIAVGLWEALGRSDMANWHDIESDKKGLTHSPLVQWVTALIHIVDPTITPQQASLLIQQLPNHTVQYFTS